MQRIKQSSENPLSWQGRFTRLSYMAWTGLLVFIFILAAILNVWFVLAGNGPTSSTGFANQYPTLFLFKTFPLVAVAILLLGYFNMVFTVKRLHDLNLTGWLSLLWFIPIVSFFFCLYIMFVKGTEGRNLYGQVRETRIWEGFAGLFGFFICILGFIGILWAGLFSPSTGVQQGRQALGALLGL